MSIELSNFQIRKIPNIIFFIFKLISECEDGSGDEMPKKIADKLKVELEKKDCFPTDHAYRTKVWNEFCERGIMMNALLFIILSIIFSYAFASFVASLIYKTFKSLFVRQVQDQEDQA